MMPLCTSPISNSPFGMIIEDCKIMAANLGNVASSLVRRSANLAAHVIARASSSMSGPYFWNSIVPDFLFSRLLVDRY